MNLIWISKRFGGVSSITFSGAKLVVLTLSIFVIIPGVALVSGYFIGVQNGISTGSEVAYANSSWIETIKQQKEELSAARTRGEESLNALALRLGQMQAHVVRLDAVGQRLVTVGDLDSGEFNFSKSPAVGGPEGGSNGTKSLKIPDFLTQIDQLSQQLADREEQLTVLESVLMSRNLRHEVIPSGRPIKKGWISSRYGMRTDPFSGKPDFHKGIDLAGSEGADVIAVGSGVVMWSGKRYGYGNMVEINHGNGYITRYGHNKENSVKVGDTVKKGQVIAKMGNTGRSTGPHVHFEVWRSGRTVDPMKFVQTARR
ncbi:MAG: M23 family metallopeptidase [Gammaproteobacteria bacterium]|nr:M23 family metallopeptidase [Gammaproteobacteria bacterium]